MSFKITVDSRYGPGTRQQIRRLEKLKIKLVKETNHVTFLTTCKKEEIIPKGLYLKSPYSSYKAKKVLEIASKKLLQDRLNFHLGNRLRIGQEIENQTCLLREHIGPEFENILKHLSRTADWHNDKIKETHYKKFRNLRETQLNNTPTASLCARGPPGNCGVVNLSDKTLNPSESQVLSKGLNFAATQHTVNILDFITGIESAVPQLSEETADRFRCEASVALSNIKPAKPNISKNEHLAIKKLKNDDNIKILPADKGNATVVLNTRDYNNKVAEVLKVGKYTLLNKDPTKSFENKIEKTLRKHKQYFTKEQRTKLTPHHSKTPHMYGLPKIHKDNVPLRPIVSSRNSPSRELCRYLLPILKPLVGNTTSNVTNTKHFVELTKNMKVTTNDILVSFDVESLFTNIPVKETLNIIEERLNNEPNLADRTNLPVHVIIELLTLCTDSNYFELNGQIYRQDEGMPMGSPLSPVFANIFMEDFEQKAIASSTVKPEVWLRYVDDTFVIWSHGKQKLDEFTDHLNNISPSIKLTTEIETQNTLPFLDVNVTRENNKLNTTVFRKKTHTGRYLNYTSNHSVSVKEGVALSLFDRARAVCSDNSSLRREFDNIEHDLKKNGYPDKLIRKCSRPVNKLQPSHIETEKPKAFICIPYIPKVSEKIRRIARKFQIKTAFKTQNTLRQHLTKTKPENTEQASKNCIYSIPCECNREYIGETKRPLEVRLKEHKNSLKNGETSSSKLAKHAWENDHNFKFKEAKIIHRETHYYKRKFVEGALIKLNNTAISQSSVEVRPLWVPLLKSHFDNKRKILISPAKSSTLNTKSRTHHMTLRNR